VCSSGTHSLFWLRRNWVAFSWNRLAVSCTLKSATGGNEYDPLELAADQPLTLSNFAQPPPEQPLCVHARCRSLSRPAARPTQIARTRADFERFSERSEN
jgi:hypothetical protein